MSRQLVDEMEVDEEFDRNRFISVRGNKIYYQILIRSKLFLERRISLDKVPESLPGFYQRLETTSWICFAPVPC